MTNGCFPVKLVMKPCFDPKTAPVALIVLPLGLDGERRMIFCSGWHCFFDKSNELLTTTISLPLLQNSNLSKLKALSISHHRNNHDC